MERRKAEEVSNVKVDLGKERRDTQGASNRSNNILEKKELHDCVNEKGG